MQLTEQNILSALRAVQDPDLHKNIVELNFVQNLKIDGDKVSFDLKLTTPACPIRDQFKDQCIAIVKSLGASEVNVTFTAQGRVEGSNTAAQAPKVSYIGDVAHVVAVASGKGGVGKSTVACNLAVALAQQGYRVGLLDADIFGPSIPKMFGIEDEQLYMEEVDGQKLIVPAEKYGVKILSIGFVVSKDQAVLWRGAMASNALKQLITEANWGELDYFIIDMPPGTSDIHLTLVQTLAITGAIVVTTPQEVALADARKGVSMFLGEHVNVPVLGIVENMSWFTPAAHPDEKYFIFGRDGGKNLAQALNVNLLGQIPLVASICKGGDDGVPVILENSVSGVAFMKLATAVGEAVDKRNATLPPTKRVITH